MTDQQLQAIKERSQTLLDDGIVLFRQDIEVQLQLVAEVERLRKEVHGHEQSLLHDTYSEFTAKREIERLRGALEFYADKQGYIDLADAHITKMTDTKLGADKGEIARKALEASK